MKCLEILENKLQNIILNTQERESIRLCEIYDLSDLKLNETFKISYAMLKCNY